MPSVESDVLESSNSPFGLVRAARESKACKFAIAIVIRNYELIYRKVVVPPEALELRLITFITLRGEVIKTGPKVGLPAKGGPGGQQPSPPSGVNVLSGTGCWVTYSTELLSF